jgi:hypothetical protein
VALSGDIEIRGVQMAIEETDVRRKDRGPWRRQMAVEVAEDCRWGIGS